jgi:hypothetical protein
MQRLGKSSTRSPVVLFVAAAVCFVALLSCKEKSDRQQIREALQAATDKTFPPVQNGYRHHATLGHPNTEHIFASATGFPKGNPRFAAFGSQRLEIPPELPDILIVTYKDKKTNAETGVLVYVREQQTGEPAPK